MENLWLSITFIGLEYLKSELLFFGIIQLVRYMRILRWNVNEWEKDVDIYK